MREAWLCDVYKRFGDAWHNQTTGKPFEARVPHARGARAKVACELHNEGGLPTCNSFGVFDRLQTPSKALKAPSFLPTPPPFPPSPFLICMTDYCTRTSSTKPPHDYADKRDLEIKRLS